MDIPLGEEAYLMTGYRSRSINQDMQKFESLDYDIYEDSLHEKEAINKSPRAERMNTILLWIWTFLVGVVVALVAFGVLYSLNQLTTLKLRVVTGLLESHMFWIPLVALLFINVAFAAIAVTLVVFIEPVAAGSGIPDLVAFLNGIKVPKIARVKTLIVKVSAAVFTCASGIAVGPEGPIVHTAGIIGAGLAQGKSTSFGLETGTLKTFRNDHDKMDFVACGAAAGLAAAFGSPIGGTLFVLEEGASFWNPPLIWRMFFCAMTSSFVFNFFQTGVRLGVWGQGFNSPGMLVFGSFDLQNTHVWSLDTLPCFILIGALGGLLGGLFNLFSKKIMMPLRKRHVAKWPWRRVCEVIAYAAVPTVVLWAMTFWFHHCLPNPTNSHGIDMQQQFKCPSGTFNDLATMIYNTQEEAANFVFHFTGHLPLSTLAIFFGLYFTYYATAVGLALPAGTLVPSMLAGCVMGRFVGELFSQHTSYNLDPGTAALIGGASMLCGITRMTLSLAAIVLESTNDMQYGLPIIVALLTAKFVGGLLAASLPEIVMDFRMFPYLHWEPPHDFMQLRAIDVMNSQVVCFSPVETAGHLVQVLRSNRHNAFPVVEQQGEWKSFRGIVSRAVLIHLLRKKMFGDLREQMRFNATVADFQELYPRVPPIESIHLELDEESKIIALTPYMNTYPYTLDKGASLSRVFRLFRMMGLRHIVVVNKFNSVVGIITRKDLTHLEWVVKQEENAGADDDGAPDGDAFAVGGDAKNVNSSGNTRIMGPFEDEPLLARSLSKSLSKSVGK